MAITSHWYALALSKLASGTLWNASYTADTIDVALVTSAYTPNQDTDSFWSTPQANETTGTGYAAGGVALAGKSVGAVIATHDVPLLASNSVWSAASFTCRYAVIYRSTGTAGTSPLIGWVDFGSNETVASGTFTVQWDPTQGILALAAS